jgi:hypothetical protein
MIVAIGMVTLASDAVTIVMSVMNDGLAALGPAIPRWFLTATLLYLLWRGYQWARWVFIILCSAGFLMLTMALLQTPYVFFIGIDVVLAIIIGLLAASPSILSFLAYQRSRRAAARLARRGI